MFRTIEVDGFRSLEGFVLRLSPGLNVLVGANGSGKTNVIAFLGFISTLTLRGLQIAMSAYGGSGSVFRKIGRTEYANKIAGTIYGYVPCPEIQENAKHKFTRNLLYSYKFEIALSGDRESVHFETQRLRLAYTSKRIKDAQRADIEWGLDVLQSLKDDGEWQIQIDSLDEEFKDEATRFIKRPVNEIILDRTAEDRPLVLCALDFAPSEYAIPLLEDFRRGLVFNPIPHTIRQPEDSARLPGVSADGSGLSASLFALKRKKKRPTRYAARRPLNSPEFPFSTATPLSRLIEYFQLAYPALTELDVSNDTFQNTIRVRATIDGPDKAQVPLTALSDGTLKWMSFVTAILTNRRILAVEEPENYVHPTVQREAIRLIRDHIGASRAILISTHSETVINSVQPSELVVVSTQKGRTLARRISRPNSIVEQINKTGFGLAFYLNSGVLDDA